MADEKKPAGPRGVLGDMVKVETMLQLALALPLGCGLGWLLGHWADGHFQTHWLGIAGILLGAAGGFIQIFTTAARFMKDGRK